MHAKNVKWLCCLAVLGLIGTFSCHSSKLDLLPTESTVKIFVEGLDEVPDMDTFQLHISGVNLDVNNDLLRSNYFNIYRSYHNINDLMNGVAIEEERLSQGKWRIAIELSDWKTACSIVLEDQKINQLVFDFQKETCP